MEIYIDEACLNYEWWYDVLYESFSDEFFESNEEWIGEDWGVASGWFSKLSHRDPKEVAKIVERAFNLYKL